MKLKRARPAFSPARLLLFGLAVILTVLCAGRYQAEAQGADAPVVIADGSLILKSLRCPWSGWSETVAGSEKKHPESSLMLAKVRISNAALSPNDTEVPMDGKKCEVNVTYGTTRVQVRTDNRDADIRVKLTGKKFSDFTPSNGGSTLTLADSQKISEVEVKQDGKVVLSLKGLKIKTTITFLPTGS